MLYLVCIFLTTVGERTYLSCYRTAEVEPICDIFNLTVLCNIGRYELSYFTERHADVALYQGDTVLKSAEYSNLICSDSFQIGLVTTGLLGVLHGNDWW